MLFMCVHWPQGPGVLLYLLGARYQVTAVYGVYTESKVLVRGHKLKAFTKQFYVVDYEYRIIMYYYALQVPYTEWKYY